ncbi:uncharacterized protein LOC117102042 [Anneissia japonica]|uniref:uncharacterized protein LOC117102042 n=1 Tax=Anneissia japonica TaxID=1529436 RepID=UPI001425BAA7|nr:uncharacterized protein LOC117102042 [Anneissia japonica]
MGMPRMSASSWKWESGETVNLLNWGSNEPNLQDSKSAGVYMTTQVSYVPGKWHDLENTQRIGFYIGSPGYGYICEKLTIPTTQVSTTVGGTSMQSLTSTIKLSTTRRPTSSSFTVIDRTTERSSISDETITANAEATTKLFTTASGTSSQSLTSGVQRTSISTTVRESRERTANTDDPSTKAATDTATLLSTTDDETIQLTSGRSMQPNNSTPTLPTTGIDETKEGTGTSYKPSMKTRPITEKGKYWQLKESVIVWFEKLL